MLKTDLKNRLGQTDPDRIVFVGIGNRMRGDDASGVALLSHLDGLGSHILDAGVTPEEYTGIIKRLKPTTIVFLDALDFGGLPGQMKIIEIEDISQNRVSIHKISLDIIMDYLKQETGADVFLLGLQYASLSFNSGLSPGMKESVQECADSILSAISS